MDQLLKEIAPLSGKESATVTGKCPHYDQILNLTVWPPQEGRVPFNTYHFLLLMILNLMPWPLYACCMGQPYMVEPWVFVQILRAATPSEWVLATLLPYHVQTWANIFGPYEMAFSFRKKVIKFWVWEGFKWPKKRFKSVFLSHVMQKFFIRKWFFRTLGTQNRKFHIDICNSFWDIAKSKWTRSLSKNFLLLKWIVLGPKQALLLVWGWYLS